MSNTFTAAVNYRETADHGYAWFVTYELSFDGSAFTVTTRIDLFGDDPGSLPATWEQGIESIWNVFTFSDGSTVYDVTFDIQFTDDGQGEHYNVEVFAGTGRGNMLQWYYVTSWGEDFIEEIVAHEYGHMIGVFDEYAGGGTLDGYTTTGTLMSDLGPPIPEYLWAVEEYAELYSGLELTAGYDYTTANWIKGSDGDDIWFGGLAADTLEGGRGNDMLSGEAGDDLLRGDAGDDTLSGGLYADLLEGGVGADWITGGLGNDTLDGGGGSDLLQGGNGNDLIYGYGQADSLYGQAGSDVLYAGDAADLLEGGTGGDHLDGGGGDDTLTGGVGADRFVISMDGGDDLVTDFAPGDLVVLASGLPWWVETGASGEAVITLSSGDSLTLSGVPADQFPADRLLYV